MKKSLLGIVFQSLKNRYISNYLKLLTVLCVTVDMDIYGEGGSRRESCLKLVNFLVVLFLWRSFSFALDIRGPPTVTKNF